MKVSKKYIINIREFMSNYLEVNYDKDYKLTHNEMNIFLYEKGKKEVDRIKFSSVKSDDIILGNVLLVKDEEGKVIPYINPKMIMLDMLLKELNTKENKKRTREKRINTLKSMGYIETKSGDVIEKSLIDEEEDVITHKRNRAKKLVNRNMHKMKGYVGII